MTLEKILIEGTNIIIYFIMILLFALGFTFIRDGSYFIGALCMTPFTVFLGFGVYSRIKKRLESK